MLPTPQAAHTDRAAFFICPDGWAGLSVLFRQALIQASVFIKKGEKQ